MDADKYEYLRELRRRLVVLNADVGESAKRYREEYSQLRDAIKKEIKKLKGHEDAKDSSTD